uniref:Cytochrome c oxidase subunit 4 n=1 Tax=Hadrurus spadix TaxID=141984 RepID=A0A1W7RAP4_9SCOR
MASHMLKLASKSLPQKSLAKIFVQPCAAYHGRKLIGDRDVVGFGVNGEASYLDKLDFPMPAIRFKENTSDILALREKEKGDWNKLTMEEKKALYRASFRQTFAEIKAPTGEWKPILAGTLTAISLALWIFMWIKHYVYPPLPESFTPENRANQLKTLIQLRVNPIDGISSKFDYENNRWKD